MLAHRHDNYRMSPFSGGGNFVWGDMIILEEYGLSLPFVEGVCVVC